MAQHAVQAGKLDRGMGLWGAISTNLLNMVGVGPFITIPLALAAMGGPQAMLGWILGACLALCDGMVWAELGSLMPDSGGPYHYLLEAYGRNGAGRLFDAHAPTSANASQKGGSEIYERAQGADQASAYVFSSVEWFGEHGGLRW